MNDTEKTAAFQFVPHWKNENTENNAAVLAFWKSENALANEAQAQERLNQVVMHARDASGAVAGVSTAVAMMHPRVGQQMYYFRCFIGKQWRKTLLVGHLLKRTRNLLEQYARDNGFPCIGVILELESERFKKVGHNPVWTTLGGFVYIGKSQRNLDLRVSYFRGARLKKT
jgi:hypothetical protein